MITIQRKKKIKIKFVFCIKQNIIIKKKNRV